MREISLSPLTVLPCTPLEQVEAAVKAGFRTIGLRMYPVMDTDIAVLDDPALVRRLVRRIAADGLSVLDIEVVRVGAETDARSLAPALDFAGEVGARWLATTSEAPAEYAAYPESRVVERLAALADAASLRGVGVMVEFMAFRGIATLEDAARVVQATGRSDVRICLDVLHLFRSGGTLDDVARLDPGLLACLQLNDAPLAAPDDIAREARYGRLLPGDGGLPLRPLIDLLPSDLPLAIEVPTPTLREISPDERATAAMAALQRVVTSRRVV